MKKTLFLSAILGAALCSSAWSATLSTDTSVEGGVTYNGGIYTMGGSGNFSGRTFTADVTSTNGTITADSTTSWNSFAYKDNRQAGHTLHLTGADTNQSVWTDFGPFSLGGLIVDAGSGTWTAGRNNGGTELQLVGTGDVNLTVNSSTTLEGQNGVNVMTGGTWAIADGKVLTLSSSNGALTVADGATVRLSGAGTLNLDLKATEGTTRTSGNGFNSVLYNAHLVQSEGSTVAVQVKGQAATLREDGYVVGAEGTGSTYFINESDTFSTASVFNGATGVTIMNGATATLHARNVFRGTVTVKNGGKLLLDGGDRLGWSGNYVTALVVENGGSVELTHSSNETFSGALTLQGNATITGKNARWDMFTNSSINVAADAAADAAATFDVKEIMLRRDNVTISMADNAALTINAKITKGGEGNGTLQVNHTNASGTLAIKGDITGVTIAGGNSAKTKISSASIDSTTLGNVTLAEGAHTLSGTVSFNQGVVLAENATLSLGSGSTLDLTPAGANYYGKDEAGMTAPNQRFVALVNAVSGDGTVLMKAGAAQLGGNGEAYYHADITFNANYTFDGSFSFKNYARESQWTVAAGKTLTVQNEDGNAVLNSDNKQTLVVAGNVVADAITLGQSGHAGHITSQTTGSIKTGSIGYYTSSAKINLSGELEFTDDEKASVIYAADGSVATINISNATLKADTAAWTLAGSNVTISGTTVNANDAGNAITLNGVKMNGAITNNGKLIFSGAITYTGDTFDRNVARTEGNGFGTIDKVATVATGNGSITNSATSWTLNGEAATYANKELVYHTSEASTEYYVNDAAEDLDITGANKLLVSQNASLAAGDYTLSHYAEVTNGATLTVGAETTLTAEEYLEVRENATLAIDGTAAATGTANNYGLWMHNGAKVQIADDATLTVQGMTFTSGKGETTITATGGTQIGGTMSAPSNATITNADITVNSGHFRAYNVSGGSLTVATGTTTNVASALSDTTDVIVNNEGTSVVFNAADITVQSLTMAGGTTVTVGTADNHDYSFITSTLTVTGSDATLNADLVVKDNGKLDFSAGQALTMGCGVEIGDNVTVVIDAAMLEDIKQGTAMTIITNVDAGAITLGSNINFVDAEGHALGGGLYLDTVATADNKLAIVVAPEPATTTLSLLALAGLMARRKRH